MECVTGEVGGGGGGGKGRDGGWEWGRRSRELGVDAEVCELLGSAVALPQV